MSYDCTEIIDKIDDIIVSSTDLSAMTKTQIKNYGSSIGLSLNSPLPKNTMITNVLSSDEFTQAEVLRKKADFANMLNELNGL